MVRLVQVILFKRCFTMSATIAPKYLSKLLLSALLCAGVTACSSNIKIGDIMTVSDAAKEQKLYERISHFNRARYWGSAGEAMGYITPEHRNVFLDAERERAEKERIVRSEISNVTVEPESDKAEVELEIQYFEQPTYTVRTRKEKQKWIYKRYDGGWLMTESKASGHSQDTVSGPKLSRGRMRGLGSY